MVGHFMRQGKRFVPVGCSSVGDKNKDSSLQQPFCGLARRNRVGMRRNESVRHLEPFLSVRQDVDAFGQFIGVPLSDLVFAVRLMWLPYVIKATDLSLLPHRALEISQRQGKMAAQDQYKAVLDYSRIRHD